MTFGSFMRGSLGECLLAVVASWSAACVAMNGFYLDGLLETLGYAGRAGLALAACAAVLFVLYAATWDRRRMAPGLVLFAACAVAAFSVALAFSTGEDAYADAEGNYFYLAAVLVLVPAACFVLTRTLAGCAAWFAAAAFACSVVQAFYASGEVAMSMACTFSSLALIVLKNFRLGQVQAEAAGRPRHARTFAASVAPVCLVGALALAAWFGVIAPMGPGAADLTLVTEYRLLPFEELKGTAQELPVINYDLKSQNLVDGSYYTTDDLVEDPDSEVTIDAASMLEQQLQQQVEQLGAGTGGSSGGGEQEDVDWEDLDPEVNPISWSEKFPWIILVIVACVLAACGVVGYFVGRRAWRMRRLRSMLALPTPREQADAIYLFLLSRLGRIGFKVPTGQTLAEFARASERRMDMLTEETQVAFASVTATYEECAYGHVDPGEDQMAPLVAYYLGFWKAARAHLGNLKYFFKSFRL